MFLYSGKLAHLMNVQIYTTTLFCRSKCIYQFAIASSAVRQRRNLRELHFIAMRFYIFFDFFFLFFFGSVSFNG